MKFKWRNNSISIFREIQMIDGYFKILVFIKLAKSEYRLWIDMYKRRPYRWSFCKWKEITYSDPPFDSVYDWVEVIGWEAGWKGRFRNHIKIWLKRKFN